MTHRLSFKDKAEWDKVKQTFLLTDEQGNYPSGSTYTAQTKQGNVTVVEVAHVPIKATYDEEGNVLTEASFNEDFAVDINCLFEIQEVLNYIVKTVPKKWHNSFGSDEKLVAPSPNDSWTKADIQKWLTGNNIEWNKSMLKAELLELC